jgi:ABC-type multidrug transport system ATPase subunit
MSNVIELKNVSFSTLDNRKIVQDISIGYSMGKTTAIVGPSGGGKSTVLKLSAGLILPNNGEVQYMGKNIAHMNRSETLHFRKESAFVFQDSALWANMELFQILELPLKIHFPQMNKKERADRIREVTSEVGYTKDLYIRPARLSMGEQKLIGFARALLCNPSLMFLDEWTESLDETSAERLINIVKKMTLQGTTILFVCHDMRVIKTLADYIIVVVNGNIAINATKEQIANDAELSNYLRMGMML